jgi:hypothetical protein
VPHINKPETVKKNNHRENGKNWLRVVAQQAEVIQNHEN